MLLVYNDPLVATGLGSTGQSDRHLQLVVLFETGNVAHFQPSELVSAQKAILRQQDDYRRFPSKPVLPRPSRQARRQYAHGC